MSSARTSRSSDPRVVVIASSMEGIDALARLINELPSTFPVPVVAHLHGVRTKAVARLKRTPWRSPPGLGVVDAEVGQVLRAGFVYVIPPQTELIVIGVDVLGVTPSETAAGADPLFESAAQWYGSGVIGVVLSGLGTDGTKGLLAITQVGGVRVVQSPIDAKFPGMSISALIGDDVQHAVMLDQIGDLLEALVAESKSVEVANTLIQVEVADELLIAADTPTELLARSIEKVLSLMREELSMDISFVTKLTENEAVITYSAGDSGAVRLRGTSRPRLESLCQQVLDGTLPVMAPDVDVLRLTHDVPVLAVSVRAYMAIPIRLGDGKPYGMLCCLNTSRSHELDQLHFARLQMSARQIARLIDEAGVS